MSSYNLKAKNKKTGEVVEFYIDDNYQYVGDDVYTPKQFFKMFDIVYEPSTPKFKVGYPVNIKDTGKLSTVLSWNRNVEEGEYYTLTGYPGKVFNESELEPVEKCKHEKLNSNHATYKGENWGQCAECGGVGVIEPVNTFKVGDKTYITPEIKSTAHLTGGEIVFGENKPIEGCKNCMNKKQGECIITDKNHNCIECGRKENEIFPIELKSSEKTFWGKLKNEWWLDGTRQCVEANLNKNNRETFNNIIEHIRALMRYEKSQTTQDERDRIVQEVEKYLIKMQGNFPFPTEASGAVNDIINLIKNLPNK